MKNNFLKNKYGESSTFLASKVVKILIALVCVIFLVYLLTQIWYGATKDSNYKKAEASLEKISLEIQRINDGEIENPDGVPIPNPSWEIISFTESEKPNVCVNENCICICDINFLDNEKSQAKKCDEKGVCKVVENLVKFETIKISGSGIFLSIKKTEKGIEISKIK